MSKRNRDDEEERFMDEIRPYAYGGALVILLFGSLFVAAVTGGVDYQACRDEGNSPLSCWLNR